jgi:hypothetical protein
VPNLDNLPAWLRHLLIAFGATAGGSFVQAVIDAGGVTGLDWPATGGAVLNAAAVATAVAAAALWSLPITRQYGVGSPGRHSST